MTFGELVQQHRIMLNETQTEYAKRFNTHASSISLWEQGQRKVPERIMQVILKDKLPTYTICPNCNGAGMVRNEQ